MFSPWVLLVLSLVSRTAEARIDSLVEKILTGDSKRSRLMSLSEGSAVSKPTDLVQGTVHLLILKTVALGPMHGWAIAQRIKQVSNDVLKINQNALYPALHRLEEQGWLQSEWGDSENKRRAKYYSLTKAGRKRLDEEVSQWRRLSSAIEIVVSMA
jgi:PadR family transcriptional regulator PadR